MALNCIDHGRHGFGRGYATARITRDGVTSTTTLHRKVYYEATGEWPEVVRHTCDNPRCINPAHLIGGTQCDNMRDMRERGRAGDCTNHGEDNGRAVLSDAQVANIRAAYTGRYGQKSALARKYNVGVSQICRILKGEQRAG